MILRTLNYKRAVGFNGRYFLCIHRAAKFQAKLKGDEHKTSRLEWFSVQYDRSTADMRRIARARKVTGFYRVVWIKQEVQLS